MGEIRESVLKQQLQKEMDEAKKLESRGKGKQAAVHYQNAANIYRRLAYIAPRDYAETFFSSASQYENLGNTLKTTTPYTRAESTEMIETMIISERPKIKWEEIGGLEEVKSTIKEAIVLPFINNKPDFVEAPKAILLYGPPGTGKTLLAKAATNTLEATFFEARTSTLLSKYFGESSKIISMLFSKAKEKQPSVIFMDEFDSIMVSRDRDLNESTRRVVGQLLQEIEGFASKVEDKIILIAATNKPWDLDDAMISRFQRKIYVPLPDQEARKAIIEIHIKGVTLEGITINSLSERTEGFSGRDIANLCREAVMTMIREKNPKLEELTSGQIEKYTMSYRPLKEKDFKKAFEKIRPSVEPDSIKKYSEWGKQMGM
ncbi:MAG: ATP-binding protein [Candidatus Aenigmarchaeota archaeon]|nr:ATP-binding protein [Candidatus Aenigmarchaeota archaeon]